MARLILTVQEVLGKYPATPLVANSADFTWTASGADFADGFGYGMTGRELLLVQAPAAGARTVTISSTPDEMGRSGTITAYSVGANEFAVLGPFPKEAWAQTNGQLYGAASADDVNLAVLRLPALS